ncbi:MAG: glycosyltransferase [Caldilineales bacterium]|nr:glycosyltransferase [Caldilineales bacterium]
MSEQQGTAKALHVTYLSRVRLNPYVRLLSDGVAQADPAIHTEIDPTLSWSAAALRLPHILHIHWVELQYSYGIPPRRRAEWNLRILLGKLRWLHRRGVKIVYTVHNLSQHDGVYPNLNDRANEWLFNFADAIHTHDQATAEEVAAAFGRKRDIVVIPHGNYVHAYPNQVGRTEARGRLGISPERFVYLCLGQVRPYKGLDRLIETFISQEADSDLLIAGRIDLPDYQQRIESLTIAHPNIHLYPDYIADEDLQLFFNAADACVLPYRRVTTSGAALLAFSFGKPIVAPALGPFPDLVCHERGVLYHPENGDLGEALLQVRRLNPQTARSAVLAYAADLNWAAIGARHAGLYRSLVP